MNITVLDLAQNSGYVISYLTVIPTRWIPLKDQKEGFITDAAGLKKTNKLGGSKGEIVKLFKNYSRFWRQMLQIGRQAIASESSENNSSKKNREKLSLDFGRIYWCDSEWYDYDFYYQIQNGYWMY